VSNVWQCTEGLRTEGAKAFTQTSKKLTVACLTCQLLSRLMILLDHTMHLKSFIFLKNQRCALWKSWLCFLT